MLVALRLALFVTFSDALAALVSAPAELNSRLFAVLVPESCVAESSAIDTAPAELNVSDPKFIASPAWLPRVTVVPEKLALFVTVNEALAELLSAPVDVRDALLAVLVPERTIGVVC